MSDKSLDYSVSWPSFNSPSRYIIFSILRVAASLFFCHNQPKNVPWQIHGADAINGHTKLMEDRYFFPFIKLRFKFYPRRLFPDTAQPLQMHFSAFNHATVFRKLASMLAEKRSINYSKCLFWLHCRLCFSLLRSSVMCLRGHRSSKRCSATTNIGLAYSEGRLESGGLDWLLVFPAVQHFTK